MNNLVNVLDFGMDLKKSIDTPNFLRPFFGFPSGGGPPVPQLYMELLPEGEFDENLVKAVAANGRVKDYTEFDRDGNPVKRFRRDGQPHGGMSPPFVLEPKPGKGPGSPPKVLRPPRPDEKPK